MKAFYAYIRVSTVKQGEKGVSLQEQKSAILRYADRNNLQITQWFEERVTAAKSGRPLFVSMMNGLQRGDAAGVVIHKIDRGARNLRDWADLGDLIDTGVAVHFANDSLDLHSRGGRLSADIQAVVASDYIRNLREETRKGIYGRLKQGLYPFSAPLGYLNTGSGRLKELDATRAPLVRRAFELYASGRHTLDTLVVELERSGLRTRRGKCVDRNGLSRILNNPFYTGVIRIRTSGESFVGNHQPLLPVTLFKQVEARLTGKQRAAKWTHAFLFRGLFRCSDCNHYLVGERQKGHVYYRCHTRDCATRGFREEVLETALLDALVPIAATEEERNNLLERVNDVQQMDGESEETRRAQVQMQLGAMKTRLNRLIDAFVDGSLDKESFEERKRGFLDEQCSLQQSLNVGGASAQEAALRLREALELAASAQQSYLLGSPALRRELVIQLCSNLTVSGKYVSIELCFPLQVIAKRRSVSLGCPYRDTVRTSEELQEIAQTLWEWAKAEVRRQDGMEPLCA